MGAALADHLQGVADADRHQAGVEQRLPARHGARQGRRLYDKRRAKAEQAAHHKLHPGEADRRDPVRVVIQHQQMDGPEQGAGDLQQIPVTHAEVFGHAEVVEPGHGDEGADPGVGPGLVAQGQADDGHQYDVEAGDEARLGGRGVEQSHLLQGGGTEQHSAGEQAADQQQPVIAGRLPGLRPRLA
ncbi:hypothetical protein D3C79_763520 [compost metagenome]